MLSFFIASIPISSNISSQCLPNLLSIVYSNLSASLQSLLAIANVKLNTNETINAFLTNGHVIFFFRETIAKIKKKVPIGIA